MPFAPLSTHPSPSAGRLQFRNVRIEWDPQVEFPIALYHYGLDGKNWAITLTEIRYWYGPYEHPLVIPPRFKFDGASIPWPFRILPGFSPLGLHIWAALPHDWVCETGRLPRVIGDAIFGHVLEEIRLTKLAAAKLKKSVTEHRPWWRRSLREETWQKLQTWAMYLAVRGYAAAKGIAL